MKAIFTDFGTESNWVTGTCEGHTFHAKLFDTPSEFGIKNGRVSKFSLCLNSNRSRCIINYDRGWDLKPTKENREIFDVIMKLLENSPKRFENESE